MTAHDFAMDTLRAVHRPPLLEIIKPAVLASFAVADGNDRHSIRFRCVRVELVSELPRRGRKSRALAAMVFS